jgi:hypothetical protein
MAHVRATYPGHAKAFVNRERREAGAMLDAAKPFFLEGRDKLAISQQYRRYIAVVSVDTEDE